MAVVRLERKGRVAVITLDRPEQLNALASEVIDQLGAILDELRTDRRTGAIVVAGAGKAFCAGADIGELSTIADGRGFSRFVQRLEALFGALESLPQPSVAAVHGVAFGGGFELALACDLRIASDDARFGLPEIKLGLLPGAGGTQRLPRLVPPGVALELLLTGDALPAAEARRLGLLAQVVPGAELAGAALALAARLADGPAAALATAKRLVRQGRDLPLAEAVILERREVSALFDLPDRVEGLAAFLDKRPPRFGGR